ncbi:MAG: hypothetical protein M1385_01610 [Candidatus Marsarchaeota archaeon]|nr:hypothetical protein [Candidatus Marsarchaeota archaeon]
MAIRVLKRYPLEDAARLLIAIGLVLIIFSWMFGIYFSVLTGKVTVFIVPFIFTCVSILLSLMILYRYELFEKYPYIMNLPSLFYRIKDRKGVDNKSIAFSMIFTVHSLVIAFIGFLSVLLTFSVGFSINKTATSQLLYVYLATIVILIISVLFLYRRIYIKFSK